MNWWFLRTFEVATKNLLTVSIHPASSPYLTLPVLHFRNAVTCMPVCRTEFSGSITLWPPLNDTEFWYDNKSSSVQQAPRKGNSLTLFYSQAPSVQPPLNCGKLYYFSLFQSLVALSSQTVCRLLLTTAKISSLQNCFSSCNCCSSLRYVVLSP